MGRRSGGFGGRGVPAGLPRWPARPAKDATRPALTSGGSLRDTRKTFLLQCLFRAGMVGIAVFGLAAIMPLAAGLFR